MNETHIPKPQFIHDTQLVFEIDVVLKKHKCFAYSLRIPEQYIYSGLRQTRSSGRMEYYTNERRDRIIIVGYAHNKLSFSKLYEAVKAEFPGMKVYTVFGCPGGKAFVRRRDLGLLAGIYSDRVFLTAEDPGPEDVRAISDDTSTQYRQGLFVPLVDNTAEFIPV